MRFIILSTLIAYAMAAQNATGDLFYFEPAVGACGFTNTISQTVASVSVHVFSTFPGATANPNNNPICKHSLLLSHHNVSLKAPIVDYCNDCADTKVGLSAVAFQVFAPLSEGIIHNVSWVIV